MTKKSSFLLTLIIIIGSFHTFEAKLNNENGCKIATTYRHKKPRERHRHITTASQPLLHPTLCDNKTIFYVCAGLLTSYSLATLFFSMQHK